MATKRFTWALVVAVVVWTAPAVFADTTAYVNTTANNGVTDSKNYDVCPVGPCGISPGFIQSPSPLQSQASDVGAAAAAHVDLNNGNLGVMATGNAQATAGFSNAFYCTSTSPCGVIPTGGVAALLHLTLDGTITPPFLGENASNGYYGGYLEVDFQYQEHDIGGGSLSFLFETDYDDTLDHPPTASLTFDGHNFTPALTYQTQADGSVKVAMDWTQPFTICPNGCSAPASSLQSISNGGAQGSIFGTTTYGNVDMEGNGGGANLGADFSSTFTSSITPLDPRYSFFSDSGGMTLSPAPVPEPSSLALFGTGLIAVAGAIRRKLLG